ncbi:hypothetical protein [Lysobacter gummosus]|uniref:hypothetical protein n=1 Tax=Lysobacter gummosus TaxID=262324 RepID=UPI00363E26C1
MIVFLARDQAASISSTYSRRAKMVSCSPGARRPSSRSVVRAARDLSLTCLSISRIVP